MQPAPLLCEQGSKPHDLEGKLGKSSQPYAIIGMLPDLLLDGSAISTVKDFSPASKAIISESR